MGKNVYLNEEKYQKTEKKISLVAILILIGGLCIGGYLIYNGIAKPNSSKVEVLQKKLEEKKKELEDKGVVYNASAKYTDGEIYDLMVITNALDSSFDYCAFDECKNNSITSEYCSAKNSVGDFASIVSIMIGVFICFVSCMSFLNVFMFAKGRNITAFISQQSMPIVKESVDVMTPIAANAAKEIAKGIKEGIKDDEE